jgi:hypothetical protein
VRNFRRQEHHQNFQRGVVLIVVLVLVVMLSLAGFGFLSAMSTEYEATRLNGSLLQARQTLVSAESQLLWLANQPRQRREIVGGLYSNPPLFQGRTVQALQAVGADSSAAGSVAGTPEGGAAAAGRLQAESLLAGDDVWRFSVVSVDRPAGSAPVLRFGLSSESAKLHLGTVLRWEQTTAGKGRQALMKLPGMTEMLADSLLDWMDADDVPRPLGAESEYYQSLSLPVRPANAVPAALHELLAVRGMSAHLLFGVGPIEQPGFPESGELMTSEPTLEPTANAFPAATIDPTEEADSGTVPPDGVTRPLSELLTVWSAERIVQPDGTPRVNLNQQDLNAIRSGLQGRVPESLIRYLLLARVYGLSAAAPAGVAEQTAAEVVLPNGATALYTLQSLGELVDSAVLVPATGTRPMVLIRSPLQSVQADSDQVFRQLQDAAVIDATPTVRGQISLEEAPEDVLRCIPGISVELAAGLVAQRARLQPFERRSLLWPVRAGVLTIDQWRSMLPEVTDAGDVFQAELIVFRAVGGPLLRRKLILDAAGDTARRVYWLDLTDTNLEFPLSRLLPEVPGSSQESM